MPLTSKVEAVVDIKSPEDKFYNTLSSQTHQWPTATPTIIQSVEVHEGDWETSGSIKIWNYTIGGRTEAVKEKVEFDEANKTVTLTAIKGHLLSFYKSYKASLQVIPKSEGNSVKVTLEVEKLNEDSPPPHDYLQLAVSVVKDLDEHLIKEKKNVALTSKVEAVVDIKSPADKFYNTLSNQTHQWPTATPTNIQAVEVHEGDWESSGSIKLWNYTVGGRTEVVKEKVEFDEANKTVTLTAVEGHLLSFYKSYKATLQVIPKSEGNSVKVTVEVEKVNEDSSPPDDYLQFGVRVVKDIDEHLLKQ